MSTRRELLQRGFAAGVAGLVTVPASQALASTDAAKVLAVRNLHTGEKIEACFWEGGKYVPDACAALNKVLRDHRSGDVHMMDPGLYEILVAMAAKMERKANFEIISGYRSPHTNAALKKNGGGGVATKSLHMDGKAMDVRLPGAQLRHVRDTALTLKKGGVGFYPVSNFVHVDTGRVRQWAGS